MVGSRAQGSKESPVPQLKFDRSPWRWWLIVVVMVAYMAVVDYKRLQCASMLRFNWCSIGVLALVRVVAIPLGKESREFLVCLSSYVLHNLD